MKKQELIKLLEKGDYWEDKFILKYDTKSFWTLLEETLPKNKFEKIRELFSVNIKDTIWHSKAIRRLIKDISEDKKDEY